MRCKSLRCQLGFLQIHPIIFVGVQECKELLYIGGMYLQIKVKILILSQLIHYYLQEQPYKVSVLPGGFNHRGLKLEILVLYGLIYTYFFNKFMVEQWVSGLEKFQKCAYFRYLLCILQIVCDQRYTYRVLQTIQMKLILLLVWAEPAVLGRAKTVLKFKYEI